MANDPLYIVANHYMMAKDYIYQHDLNAAEVRYVSVPAVLKGVESPRVVVIGDADQVEEAIIELLARKNAQVTYAELPPR